MTEHVIRNTLSALRRFTAAPTVTERCDLCGTPIPEKHEHLLDPKDRRLSCACKSCSILFPGDGATLFRRVVSRATRLSGVSLDDADWEALGIPVRFVFLVPSRVHERVFATYPNSGGATESSIPIAAWEALVTTHPLLGSIEPELEGLLMHAIGSEPKCYRASVDVCHELVGILRTRPPAGGAWREVERLLERFDGAGRD